MIPETPSAQAEHLAFLNVTPPRASVARNSRATFGCEVINGHGKAEPIVWSPMPKGAFQEKDTLVMGAMQNYVMHCDVRSWRASGVMFDKTHCDRRSNNDWQDPLLVLVDEYLVDFLLKDKGVVEHCLRSCPRQVQEVELETFTSRSWSKGEWTDERDTCVCSGRVLFSAGSKRPLSRDCDHELRPGDLAKPHH